MKEWKDVEAQDAKAGDRTPWWTVRHDAKLVTIDGEEWVQIDVKDDFGLYSRYYRVGATIPVAVVDTDGSIG